MFTRTVCYRAPVVDDVVAAFKVLGLTYNPRAPASSRPGVDDVRRQYLEMARLHHPDVGSGDDNRMKVINTAYELIQSSGIFQGVFDAEAGVSDGVFRKKGSEGDAKTRETPKSVKRRRRVPEDFANGDDSSWSMKTSLDWQAMMSSADAMPEEMKNPANHPFSHNKFFTFDDDVHIYRMIRGGATVRQVARTMGKPATFIERRLQNVQFRRRIQYVLRQGKRESSSASSGGASSSGSERHTTSTPITETVTRAALRRSPYEDTQHGVATFGRTMRKKEWEPSFPEWQAPRYRAHMTLEEQGKLDGLLREKPRVGDGIGKGALSSRRVHHASASKMGRSYENYQRFGQHS